MLRADARVGSLLHSRIVTLEPTERAARRRSTPSSPCPASALSSCAVHPAAPSGWAVPPAWSTWTACRCSRSASRSPTESSPTRTARPTCSLCRPPASTACTPSPALASARGVSSPRTSVAGIRGNCASSARICGSTSSTSDPRGPRSRDGGPSARSAARTVLRANPNRRAISLIETPSARCSRRISAHSSSAITPPASRRGSVPIRRQRVSLDASSTAAVSPSCRNLNAGPPRSRHADARTCDRRPRLRRWKPVRTVMGNHTSS